MIRKDLIEKVLHKALLYGGDYSEIFLENTQNRNIKMLGGKIQENIFGLDYGIGIRIIKDLNSVYVYTNNLEESNLLRIAEDASKMLKGGAKNISVNLVENSNLNNSPVLIPFNNVNTREKIDLLRDGYYSAKNYSKDISQVSGYYMEQEQNVLIANSEGLLVKDNRIRTRYSIQSIAAKNGEMQVGVNSPGASMGFEFYKDINVKDVAREASRIASVAINSDYCPGGDMPVIIDNGFGGVLFHEACGHSLEAEFVSKGISAFSDKLGEQVASPLVTAIDDGSLRNNWGTTNVDDEGVATRKNILIEGGVLKSYLVDRLNGKRMNMESTGSSRRQSYKYQPTSRMNNTYIANGKSSAEDIIGNTEYGLYAKKLGGGSVNPATGDFNFAVMEAYLVENGKIVKPLRGATLIGNGLKVLKDIDMVGDNLELGQGMCGASSGSIPANVGQPMIRVKNLTVGGR